MSVGEAPGGVAQVDDGVVLEWFDVFPFCAAVLDLQASEPVEEDGDAAEVRVGGETDAVVVVVAVDGEFLGEAAVAAGGAADGVAGFEGDVEFVGEDGEDLVAEVVGVEGVLFEQVPVGGFFDDGRVCSAFREAVDVVCEDVEEFRGVWTEGRIGGLLGACGLVAGEILLSDQVLHLLF